MNAVIGLGKAGTEIAKQLLASGRSVRGIDFQDPATRREEFEPVPEGVQLQLLQVCALWDDDRRQLRNVTAISWLLLPAVADWYLCVCPQGDATDAQSMAKCLEGVSGVVLAFQGKSYFSAGRVDEGVS